MQPLEGSKKESEGVRGREGNTQGKAMGKGGRGPEPFLGVAGATDMGTGRVLVEYLVNEASWLWPKLFPVALRTGHEIPQVRGRLRRVLTGILHFVIASSMDVRFVRIIYPLEQERHFSAISLVSVFFFFSLPFLSFHTQKKRALSSGLTSFKDVFKTVILHGNKKNRVESLTPIPRFLRIFKVISITEQK